MEPGTRLSHLPAFPRRVQAGDREVLLPLPQAPPGWDRREARPGARTFWRKRKTAAGVLWPPELT